MGREASTQTHRISDRCQEIANLLKIDSPVIDEDIILDDAYLAPGYGLMGESTASAILTGARTEALMLDPTYSGKAMAGFIDRAKNMGPEGTLVFIHTGGTPAIFAYGKDLLGAIEKYGD